MQTTPLSYAPLFFKKTGQSCPLFVYFRSFLVSISIQIEKSIDGVLGIQTRGRRMVGADETTELWRPPQLDLLLFILPSPASFSFIFGLFQTDVTICATNYCQKYPTSIRCCDLNSLLLEHKSPPRTSSPWLPLE